MRQTSQSVKLLIATQDGTVRTQELGDVTQLLTKEVADQLNLWVCASCKGLQQLGEMKKFRRCSACYNVHYCSRECQVRHWKHGHRLECQE